MPLQRYIPKLYGRRQGKSLKPRQARLMADLLPTIAIPDPTENEIDLARLFPGARAYWLEIGFGGGEHLAAQAGVNPDVGFLGAEPFRDGVGKLLALVADNGLDNVRILEGDARPLMEALPEGSLERLFVLHPDPWPKKRHYKRRMVSPWFFTEAARLLAPGGVLRIASDIPDYVRWTLMHAQRAPDFRWRAECADDWRVRPDDWPQTRYEAKSLKEGRAPAYLEFERLAPQADSP
ncbi:MAG: tRNA (guanosine(46)-N7)-methyltransferase TrmB [Pseudomonadota bacterium]